MVLSVDGNPCVYFGPWVSEGDFVGRIKQEGSNEANGVKGAETCCGNEKVELTERRD